MPSHNATPHLALLVSTPFPPLPPPAPPRTRKTKSSKSRRNHCRLSRRVRVVGLRSRSRLEPLHLEPSRFRQSCSGYEYRRGDGRDDNATETRIAPGRGPATAGRGGGVREVSGKEGESERASKRCVTLSFAGFVSRVVSFSGGGGGLGGTRWAFAVYISVVNPDIGVWEIERKHRQHSMCRLWDVRF